MKTTTRFFQLLSLCALAALLAGCAPKEPPPLTARAGETALPTVCAKSRWGGAVYDREDVFAALAQQDMLVDSSWTLPAREYMQLYQSVCGG